MAVAGTYIWTKDFCIPSRTEAGHAILDGVLLQLQDFEWTQKDVFAIQLSFEEALVNAIRHGNQSDNRLGVKVHLEITPERFLARIQDEGPGFDPDALPDPTLEDFLEMPCGRGVKLMRAYMSSVYFNSLGNTVTLEKVRSDTVPDRFLMPVAVACAETPDKELPCGETVCVEMPCGETACVEMPSVTVSYTGEPRAEAVCVETACATVDNAKTCTEVHTVNTETGEEDDCDEVSSL
ncbi:MAG: ATP-binding protein [Planctomycetia bacterium]|nr:ATP-binding protein [Planctomycetia bacterium]